MKVRKTVLGDLAYQIISDGCEFDGGLSSSEVSLEAVEKAELALHIKRALAEGKKRVVIDIV